MNVDTISTTEKLSRCTSRLRKWLRILKNKTSQNSSDT